MTGGVEEHDLTPCAGDLVVVARSVKTRGLKGEVVAEVLTDFPERFDRLSRIFLIAPDGRCRKLELESHWFHGERVVLKFTGCDSVEQANSLVGCEFAIPEAECVELPEGHFYDWQLAGLEVETVAGEKIGRVREILRTGGVEMLVVDGISGREHLVPLAETICVLIDVKNGFIQIDPPEGLLEM